MCYCLKLTRRNSAKKGLHGRTTIYCYILDSPATVDHSSTLYYIYATVWESHINVNKWLSSFMCWSQKVAYTHSSFLRMWCTIIIFLFSPRSTTLWRVEVQRRRPMAHPNLIPPSIMINLQLIGNLLCGFNE